MLLNKMAARKGLTWSCYRILSGIKNTSHQPSCRIPQRTESFHPGTSYICGSFLSTEAASNIAADININISTYQKTKCDLVFCNCRHQNVLTSRGASVKILVKIVQFFTYTVESLHWYKLHGSFSSAEAASNIAANANIKSINVAVCIERLPVITPTKTDLEKQYEELQEQLEFEHSALSNYEITKAEVLNKREQLKKDEDNEKLKKEVAQLDSDYQELKEIEQQHIKDAIISSRKTEADASNNRKSLYRKLDLPLFLLAPSQGDPEKWQLPQGSVNSRETLREAAERIVKDHIGEKISVHFMSNAPSGIYRRPERDGVQPGSPKVFFYQAQLLGAAYKHNETWSDCIWASKDELAEYLPSNYHQSVIKFLL